MTRLRTRPQANKLLSLPAGVSATWRQRKGGRRPYFEYQVLWADDQGHPKIRHFYVGVEPTPLRRQLVRLQAIAFRRAYELQRQSITHLCER